MSASTDAKLSALVVNDGTNDRTLTPTFVPGTFDYDADVGNAVTTVTLTATVNNANASVTGVTLDGTAIADTDFSDGITVPSLAEDDNEIVVTVTAENNVNNTKDYTVTVSRARRGTTTPTPPGQVEVPNDWSLIPTGLGRGRQVPAAVPLLDEYRRLVVRHRGLQHLRPGPRRRRAHRHPGLQLGLQGGRLHLRFGRHRQHRHRLQQRRPGVPIHWLNGNKVADDYADFYDGSWDDEANDKNELGANGPDTSQSANYPMTGCQDYGEEAVLGGRSLALGQPTPRVGRPNSSATGAGPIHSLSFVGPSDSRPMYGLSQVFEVGAPTDVTLRDLELEGAPGGEAIGLSPAFDSATETYTASVANRIAAVTLTARKKDTTATVAITNDDDTSTEREAELDLNVGSNTLTLTLTAADATPKTYTITVTRAAVPPAPTDCPADTDWCTTLGVGYASESTASFKLEYWGYRSDRSYGDLLSTTFSHGGTGYTVSRVDRTRITQLPGNTVASDNLTINISPVLPDGTVLQLGSRTFTVDTDSATGTIGQEQWGILNNPLSWTAGQHVTVSLKFPTAVKTPRAISIADASAAENAGHLVFNVTLSRSLPNTVKVDFETISGGTATEGEDYHARRTYTHVIPPRETTVQMGFALIEDTVDDVGETVKVRISNARVVDAYGDKIKDLDITTAEATGTITAPLTSTTNVPGLTIGIKDATGNEEDGWIDFRVRLSKKYDDLVCYDFETISGGTATEGTDYLKIPRATYWMQSGKRVDKPFVRIIDDSINDNGETVKVKISNARLCNDASKTIFIENAEATGTINNSDPMPLAWMVRFGRTVGSQVVDALGQRLDSGTASHVTVGGINLTGEPGALPETPSDDPFGLPDWATRTQREESAQSLTANELLLRSAFHLSSGGGQGGGAAYTAWGRVARSGFDAEVDDVTMDADVTSGLIGFDAEWERVLAGVMLSQSSGEGSYRLDPQKGNDAGTVNSSLSGVYPYARLELNRQVSAWALAGAGSGELTLQQEGEKPMPTDITMRMGAVGVKGQVLDGTGPSGLAMNVKSDAMWVGTQSERTADMVATQGDVTRLRVILEGERAFAIGEDATFTPSAEVGLRHDGGDAETRHRPRGGRRSELRRGPADRRRPGADAGRARGVRIRGVGRERGDAHHAQRVRARPDAQHYARMGPHGKRDRAAVVRKGRHCARD